MKIVKQSHEIITEPDQLKLIELAGRTCYKSEDKITSDSASRFVKMLVKSGHHAMLEFGYICFEVKDLTIDTIRKHNLDKYIVTTKGIDRSLVSGNFRAWFDYFENQVSTTIELISIKKSFVEMSINKYLHIHYPGIFTKDFFALRYPTVILEKDMTPEERKIHAVRTVRFITNRGVTHELVRHRPCSFAQESTRYVNYKGGMQFIKPVWFDTATHLTQAIWEKSIFHAAVSYDRLLRQDWKPEQAREVLPNSLKTEIVVQATLAQWKHIFTLRCHKAAHPQIRALMQPLEKEMFGNE